jgi:hypothetical protein
VGKQRSKHCNVNNVIEKQIDKDETDLIWLRDTLLPSLLPIAVGRCHWKSEGEPFQAL